MSKGHGLYRNISSRYARNTFDTYTLLIQFITSLETVQYRRFILFNKLKEFPKILHVILYPNLNSACPFLSSSPPPHFLFQFTLYFTLPFSFFHIPFPFRFHYAYPAWVYRARRLVTCDSLSEFGITCRVALDRDWTKEIEGEIKAKGDSAGGYWDVRRVYSKVLMLFIINY
jgi:hypothetical protein